MYYLHTTEKNYAFYDLNEALKQAIHENEYWLITDLEGNTIVSSEQAMKKFYIENPMAGAPEIKDKYYDDYNDAVKAMREHPDNGVCVFRTSDNVNLACKRF